MPSEGCSDGICFAQTFNACSTFAQIGFGFALGKTGAAMIIGGALGNVIDRLIHGHVVDFLLFYWQDWFYPAFNIADSFICVGAVLAVLDNIVNRKTGKKNVGAS